MKTIWITVSVLFAFLVSSCNSLASDSLTRTTEETDNSATATVNAEVTYPPLKTIMGGFVITSAQLTDEAHGNKALEGYKFLLIGLARSESKKLVAGEFSFESFQTAFGSGDEVYVLGSDGTQTPYKGMGGWLDDNEPVADDFVMGFQVPLTEAYSLHWTDNPTIPLIIEK